MKETPLLVIVTSKKLIRIFSPHLSFVRWFREQLFSHHTPPPEPPQPPHDNLLQLLLPLRGHYSKHQSQLPLSGPLRSLLLLPRVIHAVMMRRLNCAREPAGRLQEGHRNHSLDLGHDHHHIPRLEVLRSRLKRGVLSVQLAENVWAA